MRNYIILAAILAFSVSCNNSETPKTEEGAATTTEAAAPSTEAKPAVAAKLDPICEMEYDKSWTEYAVHNNDTVWFCSEHCKTAFQANPDKYTKAKAAY